MSSNWVGLVIPICIAIAGSGALAQPGSTPLAFEVASVKPSDPNVRISNVLLGAGESLRIENVPLRKIILYAYDILDFQLAGGPAWIDARYDIDAKTAMTDGATAEPTAETDGERKDRVARVRERLQSLLSDRFGLRVHTEQKERTGLVLRIAKGGLKLAQGSAEGRVSTVDGRIQGYGAPISMLVKQLSMVTGLSVEDETGLRGRYDFVLTFAPDEKNQSDIRPSIYSAVAEQLGLVLERTKGFVKTVLIDEVKRPSAN